MKRRRQISEWLYRARWGHWCDHYRAVFEPTAGLSIGGYTLWVHRVGVFGKHYRECKNCGRTEFV